MQYIITQRHFVFGLVRVFRCKMPWFHGLRSVTALLICQTNDLLTLAPGKIIAGPIAKREGSYNETKLFDERLCSFSAVAPPVITLT